MTTLKLAFLAFDAFAFGGTERWLRSMAIEMAKGGHEVDFFSCETPAISSLNGANPQHQLEKLRLANSGVRLLDVHVSARSDFWRHRPWESTNLWDFFEPNKYNFIQSARSGVPEYPFTEISGDKQVVYRTLDVREDFIQRPAWTLHLSNYQRDKWISKGGSTRNSSVIPIPVTLDNVAGNLRQELGISPYATVFGFHQRNSDDIFSPWPLEAYSRLEDDATFFLILGGSSKYSDQAAELGIRNFFQITHNGDGSLRSRFLNSLDVFAHGRRDGETFGLVLAEAMFHSLPCISHFSRIGSNAQPETMQDAGLFAQTIVEYTAYMKLLLSAPDLRKMMGTRGHAIASTKYSVQRCGLELERVYKNLVETSDFKVLDTKHRNRVSTKNGKGLRTSSSNFNEYLASSEPQVERFTNDASDSSLLLVFGSMSLSLMVKLIGQADRRIWVFPEKTDSSEMLPRFARLIYNDRSSFESHKQSQTATCSVHFTSEGPNAYETGLGISQSYLNWKGFFQMETRLRKFRTVRLPSNYGDNIIKWISRISPICEICGLRFEDWLHDLFNDVKLSPVGIHPKDLRFAAEAFSVNSATLILSIFMGDRNGKTELETRPNGFRLHKVKGITRMAYKEKFLLIFVRAGMERLFTRIYWMSRIGYSRMADRIAVIAWRMKSKP